MQWLNEVFSVEWKAWWSFQPTRFLLSKTSVGSVLSGTNWLGSSIFIGVPMQLPCCEDFIHWGGKKKDIQQNLMTAILKTATRGQANIKEWQLPSENKTEKVGLIRLTWKLAHHGFGPGADIPTGWLFRNIDPQVAVGRVEPSGPFSLLFLHHKLEGASQAQLTVLWWHSRHGGRDLHVILGAGFFTDNGVSVRVARSVSLEGHTERERYSKLPQQLSVTRETAFSISLQSHSIAL